MDYFSIATKILGEAFKLGKHVKDAKDEEQMQTIVDNLRRSSGRNGGNCLNPEIGSEADRLYSKMATKGYLVRMAHGYMLPEYAPRRDAYSLY